MECVRCGSDKLWRDGQTRLGGQRWQCNGCKRTFTERTASTFSKHKVPDDLITLAVHWFYTTPISYSGLVDRLAQRGIRVNKSTVFTWAHRFEQVIDKAAQISKGAASSTCAVTETYCTLNGQWAYVYRANLQDGQLLDVYVTEQPNLAGALTFFERSLSDLGVVLICPATEAPGESTEPESTEPPVTLATEAPSTDGTAQGVPEPLTMVEAAQAYAATGQTYEKRTQRALRRDKKTLILAGYGASIRVERDALTVKEGHTHEPQTAQTHVFHRGMHNVARIVCIDCKGAISFDALHWCTRQGIAVCLLDRHGNLVSELAPETAGDVALRRQQYSLSPAQVSSIAAQLIVAKLRGQAATLAAHPNLPGAVLGELAIISYMHEVEGLQEFSVPLQMLRLMEGRAAAVYWDAWLGLAVKWKGADKRKVPPHWLTMRERSSPLSGHRNRHAVDPVNAILNYAYGMLEGQCRTALTSLGFDIACGVLHSDRDNRDSLVYDLMEPLRATVDGCVFELLRKTSFTYGDFVRGTDGACRLHPQLARYIVATCKVKHAVVYEVAQRLRLTMMHATSDREQHVCPPFP